MKKTLLTILQLLVTGALLYWVFHDPAVRSAMATAIRDADYRWIAAAIAMYVIVEFAAIVRWQILLKVQGINLSNGRIGALFFIGMFYNQFLPGGTGGDIVKTYLLWKETPKQKPGALLAVMFDRMIGLIALIVITGVLIFLRYGWLTRETAAQLDSNPLHNPRFYVSVVLAVLGASVLFVTTTFLVSGFNLLDKLPHRFPGREKLIEISAAYHLYARHWRATTAAFGASLVCHLGTFATFLCVAYAFKVAVAPVDFFAIMPIERTISSLPISFAGVGAREFLLQVMLFNLCAVPPAVARMIGLTGFTVILLCSLPGGLVYFLYRPSGAVGHVKMRDMQKEFATLEHEISEQEE
ncbi:MAG TPA: lysylphosphatidylglycerol synthase transmembrane domain-containing protein [Chthoniobacterales bacterium]|nr:lysylphosphatidylglycerol synthase transmembrane domain-containing protein [Chthoniobacterales bacterium]